MKKNPITYTDVGIPTFKNIKPLDSKSIEGCLLPSLTQKNSGWETYDGHELSLFDLSSHKRARDAIEFGLKMRNKGFHVFVVGEERSGRMTSTLSYLKQNIKNLPQPKDWVYVNNFKENNKPKPYAFPPGQGCHFKKKLNEFIENTSVVLNKSLNSPNFPTSGSNFPNHL